MRLRAIRSNIWNKRTKRTESTIKIDRLINYAGCEMRRCFRSSWTIHARFHESYFAHRMQYRPTFPNACVKRNTHRLSRLFLLLYVIRFFTALFELDRSRFLLRVRIGFNAVFRRVQLGTRNFYFSLMYVSNTHMWKHILEKDKMILEKIRWLYC